MSRYYRVNVEAKGITTTQIKEVMENWEEMDLSVYKDVSCGEFEGNLCGGQSEEEAHNEIVEAIKKLNKEAKVKTRWTYLEDLPNNEYGDDLE